MPLSATPLSPLSLFAFTTQTWRSPVNQRCSGIKGQFTHCTEKVAQYSSHGRNSAATEPHSSFTTYNTGHRVTVPVYMLQHQRGGGPLSPACLWMIRISLPQACRRDLTISKRDSVSCCHISTLATGVHVYSISTLQVTPNEIYITSAV